MIRTQCKLMFLKRGFQISFSLMFAFAFLYPTFLMLVGHMKGNDISAVPDRIYAYPFCDGATASDVMYFVLPILSFFPFAASFAIDRKLHAYYPLTARGGLRSYFFAKAIACMLGGFIIFFIPLAVNILVNHLLMPQTMRNAVGGYVGNNMYEQYAQWVYNVADNPSLQPNWMTKFWVVHPQLTNLLSAALVGCLGAVSSLVCYTSTFFIKKYTHFSVFPMLVLFTAGVMLQGNSEDLTMSWSLIDYVKTGEFCSLSTFPFFWGVCALLVLLCGGILWWKSGQDLLD